MFPPHFKNFKMSEVTEGAKGARDELEYTRSSLSREQIIGYAEEFSFPGSYVILRPGKLYRANHSTDSPSKIVIFHEQLLAGLRFPLESLIV